MEAAVGRCPQSAAKIRPNVRLWPHSSPPRRVAMDLSRRAGDSAPYPVSRLLLFDDLVESLGLKSRARVEVCYRGAGRPAGWIARFNRNPGII